MLRRGELFSPPIKQFDPVIKSLTPVISACDFIIVSMVKGRLIANRDKLLGTVQRFDANEGLFVLWSGYKSNVQKELVAGFFKIRLWSQRELLETLFANDDHLDDEIKAELPLKRI